MSLGLVAYDSSDDEDSNNNEVEESKLEVPPIESKSETKGDLLNLPEPGSIFSNSLKSIVIDKKSKKIKISFASLDETNFDSSDEDDEIKPKQKKINSSSTSSLIHLLPKPKHLKTFSSNQLIPQSVARAKPNLPLPKKVLKVR